MGEREVTCTGILIGVAITLGITPRSDLIKAIQSPVTGWELSWQIYSVFETVTKEQETGPKEISKVVFVGRFVPVIVKRSDAESDWSVISAGGIT